MRGSNYTIIFATILSVFCSVMLSSVYMALKDKQDENRALEQEMSILSAARIPLSRASLARTVFRERVKAMVINRDGDVLDDVEPATVGENDHERRLIFAISDVTEKSVIVGYVYPVLGAGLWSKLYGYLAVDKSGKKILGLVFYKQGETPGLGAEIEKPWFVKNFEGKVLFDGEKLTGVKVAKGAAKLDPAYKYSNERMVDGISGATPLAMESPKC